MYETTFKITLADGSTLNNLKMCGSNFVADFEITPAMFASKLAHVIIEADDVNSTVAGEYFNMELAQIAKYDDKRI